MREYEIWSEGYAATGQSQGAHLAGRYYATSFREACDKFFADNKLYDSGKLTYWACRLFDNEEDARKTYG